MPSVVPIYIAVGVRCCAYVIAFRGGRSLGIQLSRNKLYWQNKKANTNNYSGYTVSGCIGLKLNVCAFAYADDNI